MDIEPLQRLNKDIHTALRKGEDTITNDEARLLVQQYYIMQEDRKRAHNQEREFDEADKPHSVITWIAQQSHMLENEIKRVLDTYSNSTEIGRWARSNKGVGPVIAAGLLAHIDLTRAETAGAIWRFAGLDPSQKWEKGRKRPWNADLKVLCFKIGECFVKVSGREDAFYGQLYRKRKDEYLAKNEAGGFREYAEKQLSERNYGKATEAYKAYSRGKLPPAHVHAMARRYAVKIFLSHYHHVGRTLLGLPVPKPFAIEHMGHAHMINIPNWTEPNQ